MKNNVVILTVLLSVLALSVKAGEPAANPIPNPIPNPKWDAKSMRLLKESVNYINGLQSYSTTLTYKSTLDGGAKRKKKEETMRYDVAIERPNKLALHIGEGKLHCSIFSDGATLWIYAPGSKSKPAVELGLDQDPKVKATEAKVIDTPGRYVERPTPKTLNELFQIDEIGIANQDMQNLLFLDQYHATDAFNKLMDGVLELTYVGMEIIAQDKAHHLKFSQQNFDWHLWIQDGDKPLLRRVSIEAAQMMKDEQGPVEVQLSFVSQFDNWSVNEPIPSKTFVFIPPPETNKVSTFIKAEADYDPKLLGEAAPNLTAKLLDGSTFNLADQKGKNIVVLDFWATWCGPCRAAMPAFSEVIDGYKGKGVLGYAVNLMEAPELVAEFQKMTPQLTLPILLDADGTIARAYRVQPIPMSVIVGKDGLVQAVHMGIPGGKVEILKTRLKSELDALLAGESLIKK